MPVSIIYVIAFWSVHLKAVECDLAFYEIVLQFLQSTLLGVFVAYSSEFLTLRVYDWKYEIAAALEENLEVEGLIISREEG